MRKVRAVIVVLLACMLLTGCSREWMNYLHTDESLKRIAGRLLEEKYGEEFEIYNVWASNQRYFTAICSPKENPDVVFEGKFAKEGTEIGHDEYVQGIVSDLLRKQMTEEMKQLSEECVVKPIVFYNYHKETEYESVEDITIENYKEQVGELDVYTIILLNKDKLKMESYREEYKFFENCSLTKWNESYAIALYFVDTYTLNKANEYFKESYYTNSSLFTEIEEKYIDAGFGSEDGKKPNITCEEYEALRAEVDK